MTCPTCASPLPAGAMFCGECGRAVTSADVAAQRASAEAARRSAVSPSAPAPPTWQQRSDRRAPGHDAEPWWVRDRVEPDAAPGTAGHHLGAAPGPAQTPAPTPTPSSPAAPDAPDPVDQTPHGSELTAWPPPVVPSGGAGAGTGPAEAVAGPAEGATTGPRPEAPSSSRAGGREPVEPPAPRTPGAADASSPRPNGAPLWTASLAPLPVAQTDDVAEAPVHQDAGHGSTRRPHQDAHQGRGGAAGADEATPSSETAEEHDEAGGDSTGDAALASGAVDPETETEIDLDEGEPTEGAPAPGDTALLERLLPDVAPAVPTDDGAGATGAHGDSVGRVTTAAEEGETGSVPPALVEPGSAGERCTQCGGPIHEDDIFCGECGAVVQSVARSFTGPVAPLPPEWHAPVVEASSPAPEAAAPEAAAPEVGDTGSGRPSGRRARAVPADEPREARPQRLSWSRPAPVPAPAPTAAVPAGDEPSDAVKRRLVDEAARRALAWPPPAAADADVPAPPAAGRAAKDWTPPAATDEPTDEPSAESDARTGSALPPLDHVPGVVRDVPVPRPDAPAVPSAPQGPSASGASPWSALRAPAARQGGTGRTGDGDDDDVDETRIVARRPGDVPFGLQFSTGEGVTVSGSGLLGRAPVAQPGERFEHLVRIVDPGKSVSKTHLEFGIEGGHLWVSDRWSGNGTLVRAVDEPPRRVQPGTRVRVPRGARVDIGEQFFLVQ